MIADTVLEIIAQSPHHVVTLVLPSVGAGLGLTFKGGIPVTHKTIEERIGVRTRMVAPPDEHIGF